MCNVYMLGRWGDVMRCISFLRIDTKYCYTEMREVFDINTFTVHIPLYTDTLLLCKNQEYRAHTCTVCHQVSIVGLRPENNNHIPLLYRSIYIIFCCTWNKNVLQLIRESVISTSLQTDAHYNVYNTFVFCNMYTQVCNMYTQVSRMLLFFVYVIDWVLRNTPHSRKLCTYV